MSWWTTFKSWFVPTATTRLSINGHTLHWVSDPWPLAVYLDDSALEWQGDIIAAIEELNKLAGKRVLFHPIEPTPMIQRLYAKPAETALWPRGSVFIECSAGATTDGHTIHEHDPRSGLVNSAKVILRPMFGVKAFWQHIPRHELAHVLTVGHNPDKGSVMYEKAHASDQRFTSADAACIKGATKA